MKARAIRMHRLAKDDTACRSVVDAVRALPNGELADVERALAAYEAKFGFTSDEALARIERGALRPTLEVEGWLMAVQVRDDLARLKGR